MLTPFHIPTGHPDILFYKVQVSCLFFYEVDYLKKQNKTIHLEHLGDLAG